MPELGCQNESAHDSHLRQPRVHVAMAVLASFLLLAGCSRAESQKAAVGALTNGVKQSKRAVPDEELGARKLKGDATDAQLRESGFSDKDIEVFRYLQGKNWKKHVMVDPMDQHRDVSFSIFAQPIYDGWQSRHDIGVEIMVPCKPDIDVSAKTSETAEEHVRLRFDDGPVLPEEWRVSGDLHLLLDFHSREFVRRLLAAKTMTFEYRSKDGVPLAYHLSVLNLKDLMAQEPACKFLMP